MDGVIYKKKEDMYLLLNLDYIYEHPDEVHCKLTRKGASKRLFHRDIHPSTGSFNPVLGCLSLAKIAVCMRRSLSIPLTTHSHSTTYSNLTTSSSSSSPTSSGCLPFICDVSEVLCLYSAPHMSHIKFSARP